MPKRALSYKSPLHKTHLTYNLDIIPKCPNSYCSEQLSIHMYLKAVYIYQLTPGRHISIDQIHEIISSAKFSMGERLCL